MLIKKEPYLKIGFFILNINRMCYNKFNSYGGKQNNVRIILGVF